MSVEKPTILSPAHITRAIADNNFYTRMPEFQAIKKKMDAMHADLGAGCRPCKKRRITASLSTDFLSIMNGLPDSSLKRLKEYYGVPRLLVRAADKATGKVVMKEV